MPYNKVVTPTPANPDNIVKAIKKLASAFPEFDKISVGFPGYVRDGIVKTAPNLGNEYWANVDLSKKLESALGKPARVVNDADMQGLGVVSGKGLELVLTLGTGFGTALLLDGKLLPHLEMGQSPATKNKTYDKYIGEEALEKEGRKKWNARMKRVFKVLKTLFNYDHLYIGGGNARDLDFKLDANMTVVSNEDGIKGGSRLWSTDMKATHVVPSSTIKSIT